MTTSQIERVNYLGRNLLSGCLLGLGFVAFIDEAVFHQLLHWHHFYDKSTPDIGLVSDGIISCIQLVFDGSWGISSLRPPAPKRLVAKKMGWRISAWRRRVPIIRRNHPAQINPHPSDSIQRRDCSLRLGLEHHCHHHAYRWDNPYFSNRAKVNCTAGNTLSGP